MKTDELKFYEGLPPILMEEAVDIFIEAFGQKFLPLLKSESNVRALLRSSLKPENIFPAVLGKKLAGLAGLQFTDSDTMDIDFKKLRKSFSFFMSIFIYIVFAVILKQRVKKDSLRIDALAVHPDYRGKGVGTFLLEAIEDNARKKGLKYIYLEVVDSNPRAKNLYERMGYIKIKTVKYYFLTRGAGFSSEDIMMKALKI